MVVICSTFLMLIINLSCLTEIREGKDIIGHCVYPLGASAGLFLTFSIFIL